MQVEKLQLPEGRLPSSCLPGKAAGNLYETIYGSKGGGMEMRRDA